MSDVKARFADYLVSTGRLQHESLSGFRECLWASSETIGRIALLHNLITPLDLERVLAVDHTGAQFDEIAVRLNLLTPNQLELLRSGQQLRACLELVEQLSLRGELTLAAGLQALASFMEMQRFAEEATPQTQS